MEEGLLGGEDTVVEDAHCGGQGGMGAAMSGCSPTEIARRIPLNYGGGISNSAGAIVSGAYWEAGSKMPPIVWHLCALYMDDSRVSISQPDSNSIHPYYHVRWASGPRLPNHLTRWPRQNVGDHLHLHYYYYYYYYYYY